MSLFGCCFVATKQASKEASKHQNTHHLLSLWKHCCLALAWLLLSIIMSLRVLSRYLVIALLFLVILSQRCVHAGYATPELNRRAMAGLWRLVTTNPRPLTISQTSKAPMKEFTTYPKKCKELLLMLKEDGSFQEYQEDDEEQPSSKKKATKKKKFKGTWDYLDGQLILATDRPKHFPSIRDTIMVGKVVATSQDSLPDHPVLKQEERVNTTTTAKVDTHLSVPQGSFKVGKYMYPKNHPSFFEQPIFRPTPTGSFQLRQVLGRFNAMQEQDETQDLVEQFRRQDFYDKRFYLTSHPIEPHKPKGRLRWSIKYNKFVEDAPRKKKQDDSQQTIPIRVVEVAFFQNNTFSTIAGLGQDTVLRGKWDIIGEMRTQLWMQVWRFGFGRSVSGSVYSEGKGLSKNDEKTYWGEISYIEEDDKKDDTSAEGDKKEETTANDATSPESNDNDKENKRLQVKGSVMYGWGLEPLPVARFLMKEALSQDEADTDDEEDEDEEDTREEDLERTFNQQDDSDDDIDWSNAFQ